MTGNSKPQEHLGSARTTAKGDASELPALPAPQADVVNAERAQYHGNVTEPGFVMEPDGSNSSTLEESVGERSPLRGGTASGSVTNHGHLNERACVCGYRRFYPWLCKCWTRRAG